MHTYKHIHAHTHTHTHTHQLDGLDEGAPKMHVRTKYLFFCVYVCVRISVCLSVCEFVFECVFVCLYVHVCSCVCVYGLLFVGGSYVSYTLSSLTMRETALQTATLTLLVPFLSTPEFCIFSSILHFFKNNLFFIL
jgi:hypothetical protein